MTRLPAPVPSPSLSLFLPGLASLPPRRGRRRTTRDTPVKIAFRRRSQAAVSASRAAPRPDLGAGVRLLIRSAPGPRAGGRDPRPARAAAWRRRAQRWPHSHRPSAFFLLSPSRSAGAREVPGHPLRRGEPGHMRSSPGSGPRPCALLRPERPLLGRVHPGFL